MNIFNLLGTAIIYDNNLQNVPLNELGITAFVGKVIETLSFGGTLAIGILLFSLILKIIPLPFDIYSRAATKKNVLKMEKMRPELERLQKQYSNNKELYNQKLMALYKKQGYSQFSACLPSIITLVFFMIVISAFQQYSVYCKIDVFNQMATSYSESIRYNDNITVTEYAFKESGEVDTNNVLGVYNTLEEKENFFKNPENSVYGNNIVYNYELTDEEYETLIKKPAQKAAAEKYKEISNKNSFLWIKNIWIEDLPWKKAFVDETTYTSTVFSYNQGCSTKKLESSINSKTAYNDIFSDEFILEQRNTPNGYLILVVISIASMLLSQLLMNKAQKAQMELQTVDGAMGQAAQTTKMMTWMMPIMFGVFAFMYSSAFSLYLIVSTLFSTGSTFVINKIVEKNFAKQVQKEQENEYQKRYGHLNRNKEEK